MRRFLFAAGLLATLAAAPADAGYFVVRIILEGGAGAGEGGSPAGPGPGGVGPGSEGAQPPGKGPGSSGTRPGPGPGSLGGQPGGMPMPGPGGPGGMAAAGPAGPHDPTRSIFVVIPFTKAPDPKGGRFYPKLAPSTTFNPTWPAIISHPFGTTNLLVDSTQIQLYSEFAQVPAGTKTKASLVKVQFDDWKKTKDDTTKLLTLVTEALAAGMVNEAGDMADELLAAVQAKKATTPAVDRFAAAYATVQKGLKGRVANPGDGPAWKVRLGSSFGEATEYQSAHYYLVAWGGPREDEARRRLDQLEENLRAFYLWHASRGIALPTPDRLLPVVLTGSGQEVRRLRDALDATTVVTDGFFAPEHDILVLAPERVDDVGLTFQRQVNGYYRSGVPRADLLHPENYTQSHVIIKLNNDGNPNVKDGKKADEVARMMTWAMADAFNQRDSELAAVSREGSRQLLFASGLLPRHVTAPAWLATGSAEFFHRPRGAVFTDAPEDKIIATVGLSPGYGAANFAQQKHFRDLAEKKLLPADAATLLKNVVTDTYFTAVTNRLDADDPKLPKPKAPPAPAATTSGVGAQPGPGVGLQPGPGVGPQPGPIGRTPGGAQPGPMSGVGGIGSPMPGAAPTEDPVAYARRRQEFLANKARATSWALYYHLATNHPDGLRRYFAELDKMPRDLPFDSTTNLAVFSAAFNLTTSATPEAGKVSFARFAAEWMEAQGTLAQTGSDFPLQSPAPATTTTPGTTPGGQPGVGPGGRPGSGS